MCAIASVSILDYQGRSGKSSCPFEVMSYLDIAAAAAWPDCPVSWVMCDLTDGLFVILGCHSLLRPGSRHSI